MFWGAIGWVVAAGFLALQLWPDVPRTAKGWIAFIVLGPLLWLLAELAWEQLWATRAGKAISGHPSPMLRILIGVVIGAGVVASGLGISRLFNT
jgi:hypothetical protein